MSELTALVKKQIKKQYKSVNLFALKIGIPASTINSALAKGLEKSSFETVIKMVKALGITAEEMMTVIFNV